MERDGLIIRQPSPNDRRVVNIYLTQKAIDYKKIIDDCSKQLNALALQGFNENEKSSLNQLINRLNLNLEKR